jgi:8-oxo-dGTP diphosphatase
MSQPARHSVSVAAVIVDQQGRVLVTQRRDNGHWEAPGGVLELDEPIEAGVIREVAEETGVTIQVDRLTGVYKNMVRGVVALVFRAHITAGQPHPTEETQRVEWWEPDQISRHMDEAYSVRILDALQHHGTSIRAHDGVRVLTVP